MKESLEAENQRKIYDLIAKNLGIHISKIAELMNMKISVVERYLLYLETNKIVTVVKDLGYKRY